MNYKKIISNQEIRLRILKLFDFIPDKIMIRIQYYLANGRILNLKNPHRYTEYLQWYKLNYRKKLMTECADKLNVRNYISRKGLKDILIPLYGSYNNYEEINFSELPSKFVLKTTNGSGTNYLCENKHKINHDDLKELIKKWMKRSSKIGREWPYYNINNKIICENYLETKNEDLIDYKFMCFNGKVEYVFVNAERDSKSGMIFNIYDENFNLTDFKREGLRTSNSIDKPKKFNEMVTIAEILSNDFPHVRVDLYNIEDKIYFGELTFFHGSGYVGFEPDNFDITLGNLFKKSIK